ncbi:MAG: hypothetical protein ACO3NK_00520 [Prochlorotrichaceae cyanobacterium]
MWYLKTDTRILLPLQPQQEIIKIQPVIFLWIQGGRLQAQKTIDLKS